MPSLTTTPHHCERLNATIEILAKDKMFLITAQRPVHNPLHRFESVFHAGPSTTLSGAGVNPNLSTAKIQQDYLNAKPGMVCIDDFVTPQAL